MNDAKALTITYLSPVSFASLNGSDKEADNISNIKKIQRGNDEFPYVSSQAVRRALRDQLAVLGHELSEGVASTIAKGAATTQQAPDKFIDDDLFGYMGTEKGKPSITRTSPVRVSPMISLDKYQGDLDFGTNFMSKDSGGNPNIFETEIHSGLYRGTILIELDRVGKGDGFKENEEIKAEEKIKRVTALIDALKNLWSSGRQSRFLADISPKFIAAAIMKTKNPIFLESVITNGKEINVKALEETVKDFEKQISAHVFGSRDGLFNNLPEGTLSVGEAFEKITEWMKSYYNSNRKEA
jgi:CRISPR-associated protein Cst2